jgi:hypothetical protein
MRCLTPIVCSDLRLSAVVEELGADNKERIVRGKEERRVADLVRISNPAKRPTDARWSSRPLRGLVVTGEPQPDPVSLSGRAQHADPYMALLEINPPVTREGGDRGFGCALGAESRHCDDAKG